MARHEQHRATRMAEGDVVTRRSAGSQPDCVRPARSMRLLRSFTIGRKDDEYVPCGRSAGRPAKESPRCDHHLLSTCCIPLHPGLACLLIPAADFADADEAISLRLVERRKPR